MLKLLTRLLPLHPKLRKLPNLLLVQRKRLPLNEWGIPVLNARYEEWQTRILLLGGFFIPAAPYAQHFRHLNVPVGFLEIRQKEPTKLEG